MKCDTIRASNCGFAVCVHALVIVKPEKLNCYNMHKKNDGILVLL